MATRRLSAVAGATALTFGLIAGCSGGTSSGENSDKETATVALNQGAPKTLDFTTTDGAAIPEVLLGNVYEGLVALNDAGKIVPALAKSWDVSSDNKTYTFHLQPNVKLSLIQI